MTQKINLHWDGNKRNICSQVIAIIGNCYARIDIILYSKNVYILNIFV